MKYIYTLVFFSIAYPIFSQPTITNSWVPDPNIGVWEFQLSNDGMPLTAIQGANQVWDMGVVDTIAGFTATLTYIDSAQTPGSSLFSGITFYQKSAYYSGDSDYNFYSLQGNIYELSGYYNPTQSLTKYSAPLGLYDFPLAYTNTFLDTSRSIVISYAPVDTTFETIVITDTVDGYGTLITPAGTYNDALRLHISQDIYDTSTTLLTNYSHFDTYEWLSPSVKGVILGYYNYGTLYGQYEEGYSYSQTFNVTTGLNQINNSGAFDWSISPQPANSNIQISIQTNNNIEANILITDITGREIYNAINESDPGINKRKIDISAFSEGMYIVSVMSEGTSESKKLIVTH